MADTSFSEQYILNTLYGSRPTQYSEQQVANLQAGYPSTKYSWQVVLNLNIGNSPTQWSIQRCLFTNLSASLGLSGSYTQLSEQALLNRAYTAGVSLATILTGVSGGGGASANAGLLLLMGAA